MAVQELIDKLQEVENKNMEVVVVYKIYDEYSADWKKNYSNVEDVILENGELLLDTIG